MPTLKVKVNLELPSSVPEKLVKLLSIDKKSELQKSCEDISISKEELFALIVNCGQLGYFHDMRTYRREPQHLQFDPTKIWPMGKYKPRDKLDEVDQKLMDKVTHLGKERRIMVVHVFIASAERWHIFYFDQRDTAPNNHWKFGPHIHFANYLWPEYSLEKVLKIFSTPDGALGSNIHIRCDFRL
jgi:hypothetical protein